jgi:hypothetical protein
LTGIAGNDTFNNQHIQEIAMSIRITLATSLSIFLAMSPLFPAMADELPKTTPDGLHLVDQNNVGAVYMRPGTELDAYDQILLVDAYVAFAPNWKEDYNRTQRKLSLRVTDRDVQRIREEVSREFRKVFTEELESGGYIISSEEGPNVMILRPAIVNLDISAPEIERTNKVRAIVSHAGTLTLYAEIYDSVTSAKIAQVIDSEVVGHRSFDYLASRVTNRQALDEILKYWAGLMRQRLDEAHGK